MPATEYQGSIASLGHSILSIRHDQVHNMDGNNEASAQEAELESFQKQVADRFNDLSAVSNEDLLSLGWIRRLDESFVVKRSLGRWQRYLKIVLTALDSSQRTLGEGQFRRAKKALTDLTITMLDEKDSGGVLALTSLTSILLEQFKY
ncbi:hypothetical protein IFM89_014469 [Coptis chinensis]|uniref:Uncharacterized protein n=1 Tax=Coptis chinensis TaxID=261450 RepID=A0A835HYI6_9MAGN|nr:hypothetical protein IFM89_014469 [Coptis chinensis]